MSSINHLHAEAKMLKVKEHLELLFVQYLARCLEPDNVCHSITAMDPEKMKETLFTRHQNNVMITNSKESNTPGNYILMQLPILTTVRKEMQC